MPKSENPDILVIGTGTAGQTLAFKCRQAGREVTVVDETIYGGLCAMRGCQPKKYLVAASEVAHLAHQMQGIGMAPGTHVIWQDLIRSKAAFTDAVPARTQTSFESAGIQTLHGKARFLSPDEIAVNELVLRPDVIVVATGSIPTPLRFPGADLIATSDDFLSLPELPKRIVFVGGGFISMEFAHVARACGADVTVLQKGPRLMQNFEAEIVGHLMQSAADLGIKIVLNYEVCGVQSTGSGFAVTGNEACRDVHHADLVLHGAGRVPYLDGLDLETGGVSVSRRGVDVDAFMQSTTNPRVYAIGDVAASGRQLATTADREAAVAADNILHGNRSPMDYSLVPSAVFTLPPMAGVGLTEEQAVASGRPHRINRGTMTGWPSSRRIGQKHAAYKIIIDTESGCILGAHLIGHHADEAINLFTLAIHQQIPAAELRHILWAYPTYTSDIKYMVG